MRQELKLMAAPRSDRSRRNERAIKEDIVEHVDRGRPLAVELGRRAIAEMGVMRLIARRIAGNRQEGDPLFRDRDPFLLPGQEFERAAALAVDGRGAIVAAAAELAVLAMYAGIDVVRLGGRVGRRQRGDQNAAKGDASQSLHHRSTAPVGGRSIENVLAERSSRALIALRKR